MATGVLTSSLQYHNNSPVNVVLVCMCVCGGSHMGSCGFWISFGTNYLDYMECLK